MNTKICASLVAASLAWAAAQDSAPSVPGLPEVGAPAPTFRLNDHDGDVVSIGGDADHWTVLAWYPKARTPG